MSFRVCHFKPVVLVLIWLVNNPTEAQPECYECTIPGINIGDMMKPAIKSNKGQVIASSSKKAELINNLKQATNEAQPTTNSQKSDDPCFGNENSVECLLYKAHGHTITGPWDAVMVMDIESINNLFQQKYEHNDHGGLIYNVTTNWTVDATPSFTVLERIKGICGPPLLSFITSTPNMLEMAMVMTDIVIETILIMNDEVAAVDCCAYQPATITSINNIALVQGSVASESVVVDMTSSLVNIDIEGTTDEDEIAFGAELEALFQTINSSNYDLGTIKFDTENTPPALRPRSFTFTTSGTGSTSKLYMCILTEATRSDRVEDPTICEITIISKENDQTIPEGFTAALYVSSVVMFEDVMLPDYQAQFDGTATAGAIPDEQNYPAWMIQSSKTRTITCEYKVEYSMCEPGKALQSDVDIPGTFTLKTMENGHLSFEKGTDRWDQDGIQYCLDNDNGVACTCVIHYDNRWYELSSNAQSSPAKVDADGFILLPDFESGSIDIDSEENTGWDWTGDDGEKNHATKEVEKDIVGSIEKLNFQFDSVSVFVLTNLLFPEAKVMDVKEVYFPGDLLVLGDITRDYEPETTKKKLLNRKNTV